MGISRAYAQAAEPGNFFVAGKNKIINGDFNINQRAFSSSTSNGYGLDRWLNTLGGGTGTATFSVQSFTPGTAPVAGYEATQFLRCVTTGQSAAGTYSIFAQRIEDVRTLAGQTATVSFWAKANSGTPKIVVEFEQLFGSGGSTTVSSIGVTQLTISTSWTRYSATVSIPSISGKTIGTSSMLSLNLWVSSGSDYNSRNGSLGIQSNTFDIWGVQVEAGSVATPFTTATGTLAGELAACQRYYWRIGGDSIYQPFGLGRATGTGAGTFLINNPVPMRVAPTSMDFANLGLGDFVSVSSGITGLTLDYAGRGTSTVNATGATGLTSGTLMVIRANNSSTAYIGMNAEL